MRKIQYLSPTCISMFYKDMNEFYLNYLAEERPPRIPQTKPMSVGSAFDAYVKSFLYEGLFGKDNNPKFNLVALFEAQVESHNRDWAYIAGKHCFDEYKRSGALADLMIELQKAVGEPRFELEVRGVIDGVREGLSKDIRDITFLGKPDIFYINKSGAHVIFDWKVNGYCSIASPMKGYVKLRLDKRETGCHKEAQIMSHNGTLINVAHFMESLNQDWARQLSIYSWLCGQNVGDDFIVAVDQLACNGNHYSPPQIRVAEHRTRVSSKFQREVFQQACHIWEIVHSNHIFRELTLEESQARCRLLDGTAASLKGDGTADDKWFNDSVRGG